MPAFTPLDTVIRLVLAAALGGIIGFEREQHDRPAGLRTHILVCMGSALLMLTSVEVFWAYRDLGDPDPGRIAAQVVSGIGFLGAGTILREGVTVRGLTTAASLWVVAALGLAVGSGLYLGALVVTFLSLAVLGYQARVETSLFRDRLRRRLRLVIEDRPGVISRVGVVLEERGIKILNLEIGEGDEEGEVVLLFTLTLPGRTRFSSLVEDLVMIEGVRQYGEE